MKFNSNVVEICEKQKATKKQVRERNKYGSGDRNLAFYSFE